MIVQWKWLPMHPNFKSKKMKSDIEIARSIELVKIKELASAYNMPEDQVTHYGRHMAKVDISLIDEEKIKKSNLILVTAFTAT